MQISLKKPFRYLVSLIMAGLILVPVVSAQHEASDSIMVFSGELMAKRQLVEAESVLSEAIWEDPEYAPLYIQRGIVYGMQTKIQQAIPDFTKGIELDPKMPEAFYSRGLAYSKTKDYDNALKDYDKAIELSPQYADAYYNRGLIYYRNSFYDTAFDNFADAIKYNPKYAKAHYNMGLIYDLRATAVINAKDTSSFEKRKEFLRSQIKCYDEALKYDSKYTDAVYNRGLAYLKLYEFEKSEKDFLRAIFLNPKFREARFNLGVTYEKMKRFTDAKKQYELYLKDAPAADTARVREITEKMPVMDVWIDRLDSTNAAKDKKSD